MARELTREEKRKIRALVTKWCANYDKEYGCLPLECECYMFGKPCPICGRAVPLDGRLAYCSAACAKKAHRRQQREYMQKKRSCDVDN